MIAQSLRRGFAGLVAASLIGITQPAFTQTPDPAILTLFAETAFGGADGSPSRSIVIRPDGPVMPITLYGAAKDHEATVTGLAAEIAAATGLEVPVLLAEGEGWPAGRPDTIQVYEIDRPAMWRLLAGHQDWVSSRTIDSVMRGLCFFITRGRESVIGALVVIQSDLDPTLTDHCLAEEITQTFGPLSDSQAIRPSLFNDPGPHLPAMTAADRQALALFYLPGMVPGLPRDEALSLAAQALTARGADDL